jgi:hypothetical protein
MGDGTFSRDQVTALEKILGVKLPEQGFTLEIKPIGSALDDQQVDAVVGGTGGGYRTTQQVPAVQTPGLATDGPSALEIPIIRWSAKI